jgi:hypothetical protein
VLSLRLFLPHPRHSVHHELARGKRAPQWGGSASEAAARKKTSTAAQRGKGKKRTTETSEPSVSAPLLNAQGALSLHNHAPPEEPDVDVGTYAMPRAE